MITRTLKHRFVRPLVYLVCALMVLAGDPLLALDQNVRIVPKDDSRTGWRPGPRRHLPHAWTPPPPGPATP